MSIIITIDGPSGSGKTTEAHRIAQTMTGNVVEITTGQLGKPFAFSECDAHTSVIIIDDATHVDAAVAKALSKQDFLIINKMMKGPYGITMPIFILVKEDGNLKYQASNLTTPLIK